jgi:hypothetical protein
MKTFKQFLFEKFTKKEISDLHNYAENFVDEHNHGFGNEEGLKEMLWGFIDSKFPYGLQSIPNTVTLYRILSVNNVDEINKRNLGKSYVGTKKLFNEEFFDSIGIQRNKRMFIVTVETDSKNIDLYETINSKMEYPEEYEYSLKNWENLKIINIEEFYHDNF